MADLITLEEFKLFLNRNYAKKEVQNENDIYYSNILIPGCSKAFQKYFDNDFQSTSRSEVFSVEDAYTKKLFPRYKPISSISSVVIDSTTLSSDQYKLLANENAVVISGSVDIAGIVYEAYYWPSGFNHITISYTGGYELARGDKLALCAFMARIDKIFQSLGEAEETIFRELAAPENAILETMFRNFTI